jgi:hypothetical protein
MTIIPPFIFSAIQANLMPLLRWFSEEMYRRLLGREPQHFLVRLHQHLDCVPLEESCAEYHHRSGSGAPVVHGVPRLVRILLIKYLLNLSLREVESAIRWNLLVKWFVGYAVFDAGPDHATLERFEQWCVNTDNAPFLTRCWRRSTRLFLRNGAKLRSPTPTPCAPMPRPKG